MKAQGRERIEFDVVHTFGVQSGRSLKTFNNHFGITFVLPPPVSAVFTAVSRHGESSSSPAGTALGGSRSSS